MVRRGWYISRLLMAMLVAVSGLAGCTPWPMEASGGLAERHPIHWGAALEMDDRYQRLFDGGAVSWAPSRMMDARILLARARREHAGELYADAEATLRLADGVLVTLEHDMAKRSRAQMPPRAHTPSRAQPPSRPGS
jgi:hypothetical protein